MTDTQRLELLMRLATVVPEQEVRGVRIGCWAVVWLPADAEALTRDVIDRLGARGLTGQDPA